VHVVGGAVGEVTDCRFDSGADAGVAVMDAGSLAVVTRSRFSDQLRMGVLLSDAASGAVNDCVFDTERGWAVYVPDGKLVMTGQNIFGGKSYALNLPLDHRELTKGVVVALELSYQASCSACWGTGGRPGTSLRSCRNCYGSGLGRDEIGRIIRMKDSNGSTTAHSESTPAAPSAPAVGQRSFRVFDRARDCADCSTGLIADSPCIECDGRGINIVTRAIDLAIPRGAQDGTRLHKSGQGWPGTGGGPSGDLDVTIRIAEPAFRTAEDFFQKQLGVETADTEGHFPSDSGSQPADEPQHRRSPLTREDGSPLSHEEVQELVRQEAIRQGYIRPDPENAPAEEPRRGFPESD
jgi:hypothetical protein